MSRLLAVAATLLLFAPGGALADGDPTSDVLLGENVYYPYHPTVSASLQRALTAETLAAKRAGLPIKVALIQSPIDLGVIPDLFGKPQKYADFLDQEISFQTRQPLLVVMPNGFGLQGVSARVQAVSSTLTKPAGPSSDALATAALAAIPKLVGATGHQIAAGGASGQHSDGGSSTTLVIVLVVAAVLAAVAAVVLAVRRRRAAA